MKGIIHLSPPTEALDGPGPEVPEQGERYAYREERVVLKSRGGVEALEMTDYKSAHPNDGAITRRRLDVPS